MLDPQHTPCARTQPDRRLPREHPAQRCHRSRKVAHLREGWCLDPRDGSGRHRARRVETANERMLLTQFEPSGPVRWPWTSRTGSGPPARRVAMERALPSIGRAVVQPVGSGSSGPRIVRGDGVRPRPRLDDAPGSRHQRLRPCPFRASWWTGRLACESGSGCAEGRGQVASRATGQASLPVGMSPDRPGAGQREQQQ